MREGDDVGLTFHYYKVIYCYKFVTEKNYCMAQRCTYNS